MLVPTDGAVSDSVRRERGLLENWVDVAEHGPEGGTQWRNAVLLRVLSPADTELGSWVEELGAASGGQ